jgi:hypothetical protein
LSVSVEFSCVVLSDCDGYFVGVCLSGLVKLSDLFESMEETRTVFTDSLTELLGIYCVQLCYTDLCHLL